MTVCACGHEHPTISFVEWPERACVDGCGCSVYTVPTSSVSTSTATPSPAGGATAPATPGRALPPPHGTAVYGRTLSSRGEYGYQRSRD